MKQLHKPTKRHTTNNGTNSMLPPRYRPRHTRAITHATLAIVLVTLLMFGCKSQKKSSDISSEENEKPTTSTFNPDSAYRYVEQQVAFGPRVPGTPAHAACLDYLKGKLAQFGAQTIVQEGQMKGFDRRIVPVRNIIGIYNPDAPRRILLCAHWDSRPWADHDPNPANHHTPIDGADDGASGVGVLLEIARQLGQKAPTVGVDIVLFDSEDMGTPEFATEDVKLEENSWCLGAQMWAHRPHTPGYRASFGILLDMVGAANAVFYRDEVSQHFAASTIDKVWKTAHSLGFTNYFSSEKGGSVVDDHLYVNLLAKIPCIDIINYSPHRDTGFPHYWHTLDDTMKNIDHTTLNAVGQTVLQVLYNE